MWRRMTPRIILLTALAGALLAPAPASAGTYDVYSCRLPDGTPAPTSGWTRFEHVTGDVGAVRLRCPMTCSSAGALTARIAYRQLDLHGLGRTVAGWRFAAAPDATIAGFQCAAMHSLGTFRPAWFAGHVALAYAGRPADPADVRWTTGLRCENSVFAVWSQAGADSCAGRLDPADLRAVPATRCARLAVEPHLPSASLSWWTSARRMCFSDPAKDAAISVYAARVTLATTRPGVHGWADDSAPRRSRHRPGLFAGPIAVADSRSDRHGRRPRASRRHCRPPVASCIAAVTSTLFPARARSCDGSAFVDRSLADGTHASSRGLRRRRQPSPVQPLSSSSGAAREVSRPPCSSRTERHAATRFARPRSWFEGRSKRAQRTIGYGRTTTVDGGCVQPRGRADRRRACCRSRSGSSAFRAESGRSPSLR